MGAFLRRLQKPKPIKRYSKPYTQAMATDRNRGRLFEGQAPNLECRERRKVLGAMWDRFCRVNHVRDPQATLRFLRELYMYGKHRIENPNTVRFLQILNEARAQENRIRDLQTRKPMNYAH